MIYPDTRRERGNKNASIIIVVKRPHRRRPNKKMLTL